MLGTTRVKRRKASKINGSQRAVGPLSCSLYLAEDGEPVMDLRDICFRKAWVVREGLMGGGRIKRLTRLLVRDQRRGEMGGPVVELAGLVMIGSQGETDSRAKSG